MYSLWRNPSHQGGCFKLIGYPEWWSESKKKGRDACDSGGKGKVEAVEEVQKAKELEMVIYQVQKEDKAPTVTGKSDKQMMVRGEPASFKNHPSITLRSREKRRKSFFVN